MPIEPQGISPLDKKAISEAEINLTEGISRKAFEQKAFLKQANGETLSSREKDFLKGYEKQFAVPPEMPKPETRRSFENLLFRLRFI